MTEAEFGALKPGDRIVNRKGATYTVIDNYTNSAGHAGKALVTDGGRKTFEFPWSADAYTLAAASHHTVDGYEALSAIYKEALNQAQSGKGKERHSNGESYEDQKIVSLNMQIGSEHGAIFQACKKAQESVRLQGEHGDAELLGAINYLAAAVLIRRKLRKRAERG